MGLPMHYSGDDHFQSLLTELGCDMTVHEVRAYMLGAILTVELVQPSHILSEILLKDTDKEIQYKNKEEANNFLSQFFGLWNELTKYQSGTPIPSFKRYEKLNEVQEIIKAVEERSEELNYFFGGLAEGGTSVESCFHPYVKEFLNCLEVFSDLLENHLNLLKAEPSIQNLEEAKRTLDDLDQKWETFFPLFTAGLREERKLFMEEMRKQHSKPKQEKVGRNTSCPCGSGLKYKKCCLKNEEVSIH